MRRLRIFEAGKGICILCEQRIKAGDTWTVEHIRALALGGADEDANCGPAHEQCRRIKDKADVAAIAKSKRMKIAHFGGRLSRNPLPGSRASKWKRKMNGTVVLR
jgi:hypothetical protein